MQSDYKSVNNFLKVSFLTFNNVIGRQGLVVIFFTLLYFSGQNVIYRLLFKVKYKYHVLFTHKYS